MRALAVMMIRGLGGPAKRQTGSRLLLEAARAGDADAGFELGEILRQGLGGAESDPVGAFAWYRASAAKGHPGAAYAMALCCERGVGTDRNPARAAEGYRAAARAGHGAAAHNLGVLAARGEGVPRDAGLAEALFEYAGSLGQPGALVALAASLAGRSRLEDACAIAHAASRREPEGPGAELVLQLEDRLDDAGRSRARERGATWRPSREPPAF